MFTAVRTRDDETQTAGPVPLHRGARAGRWRIEHELGRGGMGAVYAVVHEDIGKRAALKVLHASASPWYSNDRFVSEARVVNMVSHPGIVDIFEIGVLGDGRPYLVMERLDGQTLGARVAQGRLLADEACSILIQVCGALAAAHDAGIVHCDLKLDNIFLLSGGDRVKVLDWGIAKELTGPQRHGDAFIGTPSYVSPEQARGLELTTRSDVYSLGVIAYELFLEGQPFTGESAAEILTAHVSEEPPPPRDVWPDIPPALETLLYAMLAKDPADRPPIDEVQRALVAVRSQLAARRIEWAPPEIQTTGLVPVRAPIALPPWFAARWRGMAAVAMFATIAMCARILAADASPASSSADLAPRAMAAVANAAVANAPIVHVVAAAPAPAIAPPAREPASIMMSPATVSRAAHARHASTSAKPRRIAALDPDGTIEPYR